MRTCKECREFVSCMAIARAMGEEFDPDFEGEAKCGAKRFQPMTNADRIRAMSDEDLEKFINHFNVCDARTNDECKLSYCACCEVCVLDWLKQPAEV